MEWIGLCFSNPLIHTYIASGNYLLVELSQILLKVSELFPTVEEIKHFIRALKTLSNDSPLAEKVIKQILLVNNQKIVEEHLVELIDFDIKCLYPMIYMRLLPYALKSIDKIKENILLINYIVRIRFVAKDDWNIQIKNEIFLKFFQHICHYLTSDNLILLFRNLDEANKELFDILIRPNNKTFHDEEAFLRYLLPDSLMKEMDE